MTHDPTPLRETETETHHEPHGSASPHGAADDVPAHAADAGHGRGHEDEHGHGEALGPIDVQAWGAGALGIVLGLVVVACLVLATNGLRAG